LSVYCASKFGLRGFTQALAIEKPQMKIYLVNLDMAAIRVTNYQGRPLEEVAEIIVNTAKCVYSLSSGSDVDVSSMF